MAEQKSYNKDALRGYDMDDKEWQKDLADIGLNLPNNLLYTREGPEWVMSEIRKNSEQEYLKSGLSPKLAKSKSAKNYNAAKNNYNELLKMSSK